MPQDLTLTKSIRINASTATVWEALTNPERIKQYFFGTECISDWKKGSPILYKGVWEGKTFEDKGNILAIVSGKLIYYNYRIEAVVVNVERMRIVIRYLIFLKKLLKYS